MLLDKLPLMFSQECKPILLPPEFGQQINESEPLKGSLIFDNPSPQSGTNERPKNKGHIFERLNIDQKSSYLSTVKISKLPLTSFNMVKDLDKEEPKTLLDLIKNIVLPKWIRYMRLKNKRKDANPLLKRRADASRKKVLRDLREFYRILFRNRFLLSEYRTPKGVQRCLRILFEELGMTASEEDLSDYQLFRYLHQTHQSTSTKLATKRAQDKPSPFIAIEKYNDKRYIDFLSYPLSAQMMYFAYENFLEEYIPLLKPRIKEKIVSIIKHKNGPKTVQNS